jgi:hypothetical protein
MVAVALPLAACSGRSSRQSPGAQEPSASPHSNVPVCADIRAGALITGAQLLYGCRTGDGTVAPIDYGICRGAEANFLASLWADGRGFVGAVSPTDLDNYGTNRPVPTGTYGTWEAASPYADKNDVAGCALEWPDFPTPAATG